MYDTHSCGALLPNTLVGHSCRTLDERFARDFLKYSHLKSAKQAFRTRLLPKVRRQVCKTSVSYETSSKSHASSLQSERFVRDFLQKSNVKSSGKPMGAHDSSPSKQRPLTRQSQCQSDIHLHHSSRPHDSLCLPRNVTYDTPRNLTIPCACHENRTSINPKPHKVLRLSRKVTISYHVSFRPRLE